MHQKISPAKWRPFCPGGDELTYTLLGGLVSLLGGSGSESPGMLTDNPGDPPDMSDRPNLNVSLGTVGSSFCGGKKKKKITVKSLI